MSLPDCIGGKKKIAKSMYLDQRVDAITDKDAFITVKDHKPNFNNPA